MLPQDNNPNDWRNNVFGEEEESEEDVEEFVIRDQRGTIVGITSNDYRRTIRRHRSRNDTLDYLDPDDFRVMGVINPNEPRNGNMNTETRRVFPDLPRLDIPSYHLPGYSGGRTRMMDSRVLLESRSSIQNYLKFMRSRIAKFARNQRLRDNELLRNRHQRMINTLQFNVLDVMDDGLGIQMYDFSNENSIDGFKKWILSEIYRSFYTIKIDDIDYDQSLNVMTSFMAQEMVSIEGNRNEYIPNNEDLIRIDRLDNNQYNEFLLRHLYGTYVIQGPSDLSRARDAIEFIGEEDDSREITVESLYDVSNDIMTRPTRTNNAQTVNLYRYILSDFADDQEISALKQNFEDFMNDHDVQVSDILTYLIRRFARGSTEIPAQLDILFPEGIMKDFEGRSYLSDINEARWMRMTDIMKIKTIMENLDLGEYSKRYRGFGLQFYYIINEFYNEYRQNKELNLESGGFTPPTVLSPISGGETGSPIETLESNDNAEYIYYMLQQEAERDIHHLNGSRYISFDNIQDDEIDYTDEQFNDMLEPPIIVKGIDGAQIKRLILKNFFTVIPNEIIAIERFQVFLKKLLRKMFISLYGEEFLAGTNLYTSTDGPITETLDINLYDRIPYHSLTLVLRNPEGDDYNFRLGIQDGFTEAYDLNFQDNRLFTGREVRTKFLKKPLYELIDTMKKKSANYESVITCIIELKLDILEIYDKSLAFGKLRSAYDLGSRSIPKVREKYVLVDTTTESNCIYAACYTSNALTQDYSILQDERRRQVGGGNLREAIKKYLDSSTIELLNTIDENNTYESNNSVYQAIAEYYGQNIEIYNNVFSLFRIIKSSKFEAPLRQPIRLMIHLMHCCLMIPKDVFDIYYKEQALYIKQEYENIVRRNLKPLFGMDFANNILRVIKKNPDDLTRYLRKQFSLKKTSMGLTNTEIDYNVEGINNEIMKQYKKYQHIQKTFREILKEDVLTDTIGTCKIYGKKKEPWNRVRNTSKGDIYIDGFEKQFTADEFKFLIDNYVIEYKPVDTVGKFELLQAKKPADEWDYKIGAFDLETALDVNKYQTCYAAGVAIYKEPENYPNVDDNTDIICKTFYNEDQSKALEKLMTYIYEKNETFNGYTLYAHNGGKFDVPILLCQYLSENTTLWRIDTNKFVEMNGCIMNLNLISNHPVPISITFKDSLRMLPGSLEKLCSELKVTHQKLIYKKDDPRYIDHTMITLENFREQLWKIDPYLENDCKGLLEMMMMYSYNVFKDMKINITQCFTSATLAKKNFFQNYYDAQNYPLYNLPSSFDKILRSCYAGGRVESYVLGKVSNGRKITDPESPYYGQQRIFYLDVTSEYPDQGRRDLPYGKPIIMTREEIENNHFETDLVSITDAEGVTGYVENDVLTEECYGFVEVEVYTDMYRAVRTKVKPLHHLYIDKDHELGKTRKHLTNSLLFPWFETTVRMWICSEEIKYSQKIGMPYIYKVLNVMKFEKAPYLKKLFEDCVEKKEKAGEEGNKAMRQCWKIVANSTYGFFALRIENRDSVIIMDSSEMRKNQWQKYLRDSKLRNLAQYPKYTLVRIDKDIEIRDVNVAVAAFITAYSRMKLHNIITKIESTGCKVYYTDTDSVITNCPLNLYPELDKELRWDGDGHELGSLKNEANEKFEMYLDQRYPTRGNLTEEEILSNKMSKLQMSEREKEREDGMELGFSEAYFMGSKMYYVEMNKETPEGETIFYNTCAFKGFKKKEYEDNEKKFRFFNAEKKGKFLKELFEEINTGDRISQEQTQFRGGKTSMMNEHTKSGVKVISLQKSFKKYYIKGAHVYNEKDDIYNIIPHVV